MTAPDQTVDRARLVASIAGQLGSRQEAVWIVDHAGTGLAQGLADRRRAGEPLQYVIGSWPFRTLELRVDPRVLIPRPETEHVVEVALGELDGMGYAQDRVGVDLGTGSGAIALSLATEGGAICPGLEVWATDSSVDALTVARENLDALGRKDPTAAGRVRLVGGSWFDALPPRAARVGSISWSPILPTWPSPSFPISIRWSGSGNPGTRWWRGPETGGVEGMAAIEAIVAGAPGWLRPSGALVIEIAPSLAAPSVAAARKAGFGRVATVRDLTGRVRTLVARG